MLTQDAIKLQKAIGVSPDGNIGPKTLTAAFAKLGASAKKAAELGKSAAIFFPKYGILENPKRFSHFMGQLTHETGNFKYNEEIASGAAYEGRKDLGNIYPGDGVRYKGRGGIQLTGRANYEACGNRIGINLVDNPDIVAIPSVGLLVACDFWDSRKLNDLADGLFEKSITPISRKINGGDNGLADRVVLSRRVMSWFN